MQNPLTPVALFDTPATVEDLQEWIMRLNGSERSLAMTVAGMCWVFGCTVCQTVL
jgi:hypothetical protein